ncbi:MAG: hypothetical protein GVY19_12095 [Bacteroidetes bacterium]|jgi:membrane-bound ClpP family serine protease|nr:hypothetical protein [Bacteroidota bacterium]
MPVYSIVLLIALGIALLLVEFFLVPGITVAGAGGFIVMGFAVYAAYKFHDNSTGNIILLSTIALNILTIGFAFRSKTWQKMGLTSTIEGKNITFEEEKIHVNDTGKAITRLNPMGKVMINDMIVEAKTQGEFINPNTSVKVTKVTTYQIVVKPLNNE